MCYKGKIPRRYKYVLVRTGMEKSWKYTSRCLCDVIHLDILENLKFTRLSVEFCCESRNVQLFL